MENVEEILIDTEEKNNYAEIERENVYEDEKRRPVLRVLKKKTENPNFKYVVQRNKNGEWENGIENVKRIPYHLPEIIEGNKADKTIVICFGEKDADTISELSENFVGTTAISTSSYKWGYDFNTYFSNNSKVLILQDDTAEADKFVLNTKKNLSYKVEHLAVLKIEKLKKVLGLEIDGITDISELRIAIADDEKLLSLLNTADNQLRKLAWIDTIDEETIVNKLFLYCYPKTIVSYYLGKPEKESGDNYIYYSPLRKRENTPSLVVNNEKGIHDFGTDKHYSIISFVRDLYKIGYTEAIFKIVFDFGIKTEELEVIQPVQKATIKKKSTKIIELQNSNTPQNIICYFDEEMFKHKPKNGYEFARIKNRIQPNNFTKYSSIQEIADEILCGKTCIPSAIKNNPNENWQCQQVFLVDFDNKIDNEDVLVGDSNHVSESQIIEYCRKINLLPTIIYNTLSHKECQHKFRLVYVFEEPITDIEVAKAVMEYLLEKFKEFNLDMSKKNLADMFLGGKNIVYCDDNYYKVVIK